MPRPTNKELREIAERFKRGATIREIWLGLDGGQPYLERTYVERIIRACLVWEGRDDHQ